MIVEDSEGKLMRSAGLEGGCNAIFCWHRPARLVSSQDQKCVDDPEQKSSTASFDAVGQLFSYDRGIAAVADAALRHVLPEATMNEERAKRLALGMAILCVRNTCIEDIHAGIEPSSQAGDFSDVKVVTPYGEIPWNKLSRIRDDDMRDFMRQVVDRIYTVLLRLDDPEFVERMENYAQRTTAAWDAPNNLANWFTGK
jgi:hypothetical protein